MRKQHDRANDDARLALMPESEARHKKVNRHNRRKYDPVRGIDAAKTFPQVGGEHARLTDVTRMHVDHDEAAQHEKEIDTGETEIEDGPERLIPQIFLHTQNSVSPVQ